jgi:hypothetical protein
MNKTASSFCNSQFLYCLHGCRYEAGPLSPRRVESSSYGSRKEPSSQEVNCEWRLKHVARQLIVYSSPVDRCYSYYRMWLGSLSKSFIISNVFHDGHEDPETFAISRHERTTHVRKDRYQCTDVLNLTSITYFRLVIKNMKNFQCCL